MIIRGLKEKPFNVLLYGTPGVGKSTWASQAPKPLFITGEEIDELGADRLPRVETFEQFKEQLKWVIAQPKKHDTIVIDTLDSIEKLLFKKILDSDPRGATSMGAALGGFGRAFQTAETEWLEVKKTLMKLRDEKGYNLILLAHAHKITSVDTILGLSHDSFETNLQKLAQSVWVDWCSAVFFATYVTSIKEDPNSSKTFSLGHGSRVMLTERRPGYLAKNRFNLPSEMSLDFNEFYLEYKKYFETSETPADVLKACNALLVNIVDEELKAKIISALDKAANDLIKLNQIRQRINERIQS